MYVIIVYDVGVERVNLVKKLLRKYINWVQNSVFEGELTESELMRVKGEIKGIINESKDSVIIYLLQSKKFVGREHIGTEKTSLSSII